MGQLKQQHTLIFPALGQAALDYLSAAKRRSEPVVGAASVHDAAMEAAFGRLLMLPYVYDDAFEEAFLALVSDHAIDRVYAPVASVYAFLETWIAEKKLAISLIGHSPIREQVDAYRKLCEKARDMQPFIRACAAEGRAVVSSAEIAAIYRHTGHIYGESNDDKLAAIMAIFADAPKGDVVEIGSLMGKSLSVLQYLANRYQTGAVLSVDPLSPATSVQVDSPSIALSPMESQWDYEILREAVIINTLPLSFGRFNYLRMTSALAFDVYDKERVIESEHFGKVTYSGRIAVIHIDGNHDFAQVSTDCRLWLTRLMPGAWVILDDYLWAHGDGPYRVGNALLEKRCSDIKRAFVCGKALFIQFR